MFIYSKTTIGDRDEIRAIDEILVRDPNSKVADMSSDDRTRKIINRESNKRQRSRPRSISKSNGRGTDRTRRRFPARTQSRRGQPIVATSAAGQQTGRLLYVTDRESRLRFLVDTVVTRLLSYYDHRANYAL